MREEFKNLNGKSFEVETDKKQELLKFKEEKFESILNNFRNELNLYGINIGQLRVQIEDNNSYFVKKVNENCEVNSVIISTSGGILLSGVVNL